MLVQASWREPQRAGPGVMEGTTTCWSRRRGGNHNVLVQASWREPRLDGHSQQVRRSSRRMLSLDVAPTTLF